MATALVEQDVQVHRSFSDAGRVSIPEDHLHSIVSNLMVNAKDALKGVIGRQPTLRVVLSHEAHRVCIEVLDNGQGIADHVKDRLFQPFVSTKGAAGTGLGLAMTRKLVELYGGTIEVTSQVGEGTHFRVALPEDPSYLSTTKVCWFMATGVSPDQRVRSSTTKPSWAAAAWAV